MQLQIEPAVEAPFSPNLWRVPGENTSGVLIAENTLLVLSSGCRPRYELVGRNNLIQIDSLVHGDGYWHGSSHVRFPKRSKWRQEHNGHTNPYELKYADEKVLVVYHAGAVHVIPIVGSLHRFVMKHQMDYYNSVDPRIVELRAAWNHRLLMVSLQPGVSVLIKDDGLTLACNGGAEYLVPKGRPTNQQSSEFLNFESHIRSNHE